jgi:protoporphyrinogen oxidase
VDENDEIIEIIEEEPVVVEATPWFNSDTVATSMMFASQLAEAAATHFHNLAMLALGQSAHEWVEVDREEFADETASDIAKLIEVKEKDG